MDLKQLEDAALLAQLKALVRSEREDIADIIAHLVEVDGRELLLKLAFPSLFVYCVRELGYTEAAAYYRIRAARAARLFPQVLDMLRTGDLCLEAVVRLNAHLDGPDAARLLEAARRKSVREVEALVAELAPTPDRPDFARVVSVRRQPQGEPEEDAESLFSASSAMQVESPAPRQLDAPAEIKRVQFSFTADEEILLLLRRAQEISRHKYPQGRFEDLFRDALIALLEKRDPDRRLLGQLPKGVADVR